MNVVKITLCYDKKLKRIESKVDDGFKFLENLINHWGTKIMATLADFQTALQSIDAETSRIGDYIATIVAQLNRTDLTEAEEAELLAGLTAAGERLKGVGASVTEPVPDGELPVLKTK